MRAVPVNLVSVIERCFSRHDAQITAAFMAWVVCRNTCSALSQDHLARQYDATDLLAVQRNSLLYTVSPENEIRCFFIAIDCTSCIITHNIMTGSSFNFSSKQIAVNCTFFVL